MRRTREHVGEPQAQGLASRPGVEFHGLQSPLARNEIHKYAEVAGKVAKRPGDQGEVRAAQA